MTRVVRIKIINRDPVAITSLLRTIGRKEFQRRMAKSVHQYPRFSELYLEIKENSCWLMGKGQYTDNIFFDISLDEIPLFGWQVWGIDQKRKKL